MAVKGFLESFFEEFEFKDWVKIIDWLLKDDKFSEWSSTELKKFVMGYKNLSIVTDGLYLYAKKVLLIHLLMIVRRIEEKNQLLLWLQDKEKLKILFGISEMGLHMVGQHCVQEIKFVV